MFPFYQIDYIEQYVPMAKPLAYWHSQALGFSIEAYKGVENDQAGIASYLLCSNNIRLVLTSAYPSLVSRPDNEIMGFINSDYAGVKRIAIRVDSVKDAFANAILQGAIPVKFPTQIKDNNGFIENAAIRLYDHNELVFLDRKHYSGVFLPGYKKLDSGNKHNAPLFHDIDHIASELRINQINYWTEYLQKSIGIGLVQKIERSADNKTGMLLNICQSHDKNLTMVMAEPEKAEGRSKVQQNIDNYGPGIHHLAFTTRDIISAVKTLNKQQVDMVGFPSSYYKLLRSNPEFRGLDIDALEEYGILVDMEGDSCLLQKFIKPYGDRPFFLYEILQRINNYNGFALKNINMLKKAEEMELIEKALIK